MSDSGNQVAMTPQCLVYETQPTDSNLRVDSKAAEHRRLYREQHREEINKRRRELRQNKQISNQIQTLSYIQNINEIEQITHSISDNQLIPNSKQQRQKRYYEKHKEEINKRKRDRRLQNKISKSIPATPAERARKHRERKKQKLNELRKDSRLRQKNLQRVNTECNISNIESIDQITNSTPNDQQNFNSSNENIIQNMAHNSTTTLELHNPQHFEETYNDRVPTRSAASQTTKGQNSNYYSHYNSHNVAPECFIDSFKNNQFGNGCPICERPWFERDLKEPRPAHEDVINGQDISKLEICSSCKSALDKNKTPNFSVNNEFRYPEKPQHLPTLNYVTERLLSPCIPFTQISRSRNIHGQFGVCGAVNTVPVTVNTMVCDEIKIEKEVIQETTINAIPANSNYLLDIQEGGYNDSSCSRLDHSEKSFMTGETSQNHSYFQSFHGDSAYHSTKFGGRKLSLEKSLRCMRELIDATAKHDGHVVFGEQIAQKLRSSKKNAAEVDVAKQLIDTILQNLTIGAYSIDTKIV